jgi:hypothetical protein
MTVSPNVPALPGLPEEVIALADERARAKASRDFATADALRARIGDLGFLVTDAADGYRLTPKPPFDVLSGIDAIGPVAGGARCAVVVLVDGWPEDVAACVTALVEHSADDIVVVAVDFANVDGAGSVVHSLALAHPDRVVEVHLSAALDQVGWGRAVAALTAACLCDLVAFMDVSTVIDGDALGPILAEFAEPDVWASGWRGVDVNLADNWRSFVDAGPGEVDAILGYLIVVRRDRAVDVPPHPKARFYRNADMEWSLALREAGGRLVIPDGVLPLHQDRHHGYHDSDPAFRDRESKKTYDRILARFRSRPEILHPRP